LPSLTNLALKSAMSSQIFGAAAVSPPVLELSGKRFGIFAAASSKVANAFFAASASKGVSPLTIFASAPADWPLAFMSALRAAIGSCWARTVVPPIAVTATNTIAEANFINILPAGFSNLGQTPGGLAYSCFGRETSCRGRSRNGDNRQSAKYLLFAQWRWLSRCAAVSPAYRCDGCDRRAKAHRRPH